jgi:hypothetical protein
MKRPVGLILVAVLLGLQMVTTGCFVLAGIIAPAVVEEAAERYSQPRYWLSLLYRMAGLVVLCMAFVALVNLRAPAVRYLSWYLAIVVLGAIWALWAEPSGVTYGVHNVVWALLGVGLYVAIVGYASALRWRKVLG